MGGKHEKIERYLNKKMSNEERQAFEEELGNDQSLKSTMAFQEGLDDFMKERAPEFEDIISDLGDKYFGKKNKKKFIFKWWIYVPIVLLVGLVWAFFLRNPDQSPTAFPNEKNAAPIENKEVEPNFIEENVDQKDNNTDVKEDETQPIATNISDHFVPNPILESLLKETYRNDIVTILSYPKKDEVLKFEETVDFLLKGKTTALPPYRLVVYNNNSSDFENDYRVLNKELEGYEANGEYTFRFNAQIPFKRGLYYLIVQDQSESNILHISKFFVK